MPQWMGSGCIPRLGCAVATVNMGLVLWRYTLKAVMSSQGAAGKNRGTETAGFMTWPTHRTPVQDVDLLAGWKMLRRKRDRCFRRAKHGESSSASRFVARI